MQQKIFQQGQSATVRSGKSLKRTLYVILVVLVVFVSYLSADAWQTNHYATLRKRSIEMWDRQMLAGKGGVWVSEIPINKPSIPNQKELGATPVDAAWNSRSG